MGRHDPQIQNYPYQINDKKISIYFLGFWSDDLEPNYGKVLRGSIWMNTMVVQSEELREVTLANVYPLAVAPKASDHRAVSEILFQDIKNMKHMADSTPAVMHNGRTKRCECVSGELAVIVQDQPERRGYNCLLIGGSGCHGRWGYSVGLSQIEALLIPCSSCKANLFANTAECVRPSCKDCYCWFASDLHVEFKPEENYPEELLSNDGTIPMRELDYTYLQGVTEEAHNKIVESKWSDKQAKAYLSTNCLNTQAIREIIYHANNCKDKILAESSEDEEIRVAMQNLVMANPSAYQKWGVPPVWKSGISIQQSTEPAVHQLFLGIVKDLALDLQGWAKLQLKYSSMRRHLDECTTELQALNLSWLKTQRYKGAHIW